MLAGSDTRSRVKATPSAAAASARYRLLGLARTARQRRSASSGSASARASPWCGTCRSGRRAAARHGAIRAAPRRAGMWLRPGHPPRRRRPSRRCSWSCATMRAPMRSAAWRSSLSGLPMPRTSTRVALRPAGATIESTSSGPPLNRLAASARPIAPPAARRSSERPARACVLP